MMKLLTIIDKNFKVFTRSKVSSLIIFLGPLILVSLIGMSFSNMQMPGLTVGTFAPDYNDFTDSITAKIKENKFEITKYDSKELCSDAVKKGDIAICLVFPKDMSKTNNEVSFIVDYSKINLVWIVVDIFTNRVSERATELRQSYATDLLNRVVKTKEDLTKEKTDLGTLNSKQTDSKNSLSSATSSLNEINPTTSFGDVSIADAKSSLTSITSRVDSAKSKIAAAKSIVSSSALEDAEKGDILDGLNSASSSLNGASIFLEGNDSINSMEYIISALDAALTNAKAQLEQIKQKKTAVKGSLVTLDGSISDSIKAVDSLKTSVDTMMTRLQNVQSSDAEQLVSPIKTKIEPVSSEETHFNYLFPTLIVLIMMITAILLSSTLVMNEKKSKSMFRNFITPTTDFVFNAGTFLTALLAIFGQLLIFLLISHFFFSTDVFTAFLSSLLILVLVTSTFILLGMIIGFVFKSEETYVLASVTVSALLMFLSSTIMPIESISNSVRVFASYTPFVVSETLLRQVMFFHFSLSSLWRELLVLVGYVVIFFGVIYALQKLARYNISIKKKEDIKK